MAAGRIPFLAAAAVLGAALIAGPLLAADRDTYARIGGGALRSVLPVAKDRYDAQVGAYWLAISPVTNAEFANFTRSRPEWRRGKAPRLFVDENYLQHWAAPDRPGRGTERQPVTQVSWFASQAYCEAQGARLPTWHEWEFAAAADSVRPDARDDPAWRQQILDWYSKPGGGGLAQAGSTPANFYGVRDLHGVVWEWVEDFGAMMVSGDNREQGDPGLMKFCGAGAMTMEQKENYAVLMRIAMLSSLKAAYTTAHLGFRCARDAVP